MVKQEIRILGIDDAPFSRKQKKVLVVATVYRGGNYIDGLLSFYVKNDGNDATDKIIQAIKKTRHKEQLQCIMIDGIAVAGFNVIDIQKLNKATKLPIIVVMRKLPEIKKFLESLRKINKKGIRLIKKAGKIKKMQVHGKDIYIQIAGIKEEEAKKILKISCTHSAIPEPLRVAHLIATGIHDGESRGRA